MHIAFDIPELPERPSAVARYWGKAIFGSLSSSHTVLVLSNTFVRLTEASFVEYRLGESRLREFWDTHDTFYIGAMNRSVAHFESCVSNTYRAVACYRRLRRQRDPLASTISRDKPRFATDAAFDAVRAMRNEIHHVDEALINGRLKQGQPGALRADGPERPHPTETNNTIKTIDRLEINQTELRFAELSAWLMEMGECIAKLAQ